jgi:hypothetical protein
MKAMDMSYAVGDQHSLHLVSDNNGSLIALAAPLCRSGWQDYRAEELGEGGNEIVRIYRPKEEVLHPAHVASIEGKAVTLNHPDSFLGPHNTKDLAVGHVQNVRRGDDTEAGEVQLVGDIHVTDQQGIDRVSQGTRDLSLGYTYNLDAGPAGEAGSYTQRDLMCNHVAIVPRGRSGTSKIIDALPESDNEESPLINNELATDTIPEGDEDDMSPELQATLTKMCGLLESLVTAKNSGGGEAEDAECSCGAEEGDTHHKRCPMASKSAEDVDEIFSDRSSKPEHFEAKLIPVGNGRGGITNPTTGRDSYLRNVQALENLRAIKPSIIAYSKKTGDKSAIREFNQAIVGLKREIADYERGAVREPVGPSRQISDADPVLAERHRAAAEFEAEIRKFHRQPTPGDLVMSAAKTESTYFPQGGRRAADAATAAEPSADESFEEQCRRHFRK